MQPVFVFGHVNKCSSQICVLFSLQQHTTVILPVLPQTVLLFQRWHKVLSLLNKIGKLFLVGFPEKKVESWCIMTTELKIIEVTRFKIFVLSLPCLMHMWIGKNIYTTKIQLFRKLRLILRRERSRDRIPAHPIFLLETKNKIIIENMSMCNVPFEQVQPVK